MQSNLFKELGPFLLYGLFTPADFSHMTGYGPSQGLPPGYFEDLNNIIPYGVDGGGLREGFQGQLTTPRTGPLWFPMERSVRMPAGTASRIVFASNGKLYYSADGSAWAPAAGSLPRVNPHALFLLSFLSLSSTGANEMTQSMQFLRQFMRAFQQEAASTRIFFPDNKARFAGLLSWCCRHLVERDSTPPRRHAPRWLVN